MNIIKKISLIKKLLISFSFLVLSSIVISIISLNELSKINKLSENMGTNLLPSISSGIRVSYHFSRFRNRELQHILSTTEEEMRSWEKAMEEDKVKINDNLKKYEMLIDNQKEKELNQEFKILYNTYFNLHDKMIQFSSSNKNSEARAILSGEMRTTFNKINDIFREVEKLNREFGDNAVTLAKSSYEYSKSTLLTIGIVILIGSSLLILLIIYSIKSQLNLN
ncbi:MAG: MCP four helix bundle domain-containing protein [Leptospiraceae bacterium]|nr:MCP four helix bundle domain-containing protein [Nanoarchaeota archaeon]MCP5498198.1 MCP four helix bundle domain-containing protein [Leptospiraceae bacterium]